MIVKTYTDKEIANDVQLSAIQWHLQANFYPPYDLRLAKPLIRAISACLANDPNKLISLGSKADRKRIRAGVLCEDFKL